MDAYTIIARKRDGEKLSAEEIEFFITGYARDRIPDYQAAALLMAIYLRGMDFEETAALTRAMLESGVRLDWSGVPGRKIDKHSTGGVGDKVSLILAPLVAAAGVKVPMISGRGLGHSGGTLDKLEAIPGFRTRLTVDEFYRQVERIGVAMIGQTEQIVPADKKLYALRDAIAAIESIPLITGSILSKKLAEGIDGLVLDVKTGRGAFMKSEAEARRLADSLVKTAALNGLPTTAVITCMDDPLGFAVGNWLEVAEAIRCLQNEGPADLMEVTLTLGVEMLRLASRRDENEARELLDGLIRSGAAFAKFVELVEAQGGDSGFLLKPENYPPAKHRRTIVADGDGFVGGIDALAVGKAALVLGAGRRVMEDRIDHKAGVLLHVRRGDRVQKGTRLAELLSDRATTLEEAAQWLQSAFTLQQEPPLPRRLIVDILGNENDRRP